MAEDSFIALRIRAPSFVAGLIQRSMRRSTKHWLPTGAHTFGDFGVCRLGTSLGFGAWDLELGERHQQLRSHFGTTKATFSQRGYIERVEYSCTDKRPTPKGSGPPRRAG